MLRLMASSVAPLMLAGSLEQVCRLLADSGTGGEISRLLAQAGLQDQTGESTKWKRLYGTLDLRQRQDGDGRALVAVLHAFMEPGRFADRPEAFEALRAQLNRNLALLGLDLQQDGRVHAARSRARTLDEAQERADALGAELRRRNVHPDVLALCRTELLLQNYFHAVLEACKSVADKVRSLSGLTGDGSELFDRAFSLSTICRPSPSTGCRTCGRPPSTPDWRPSPRASTAPTATRRRTRRRSGGPPTARRRWTC